VAEVIFTETKLKGAFIIDLERREDDRGSFARALCQRELGKMTVQKETPWLRILDALCW
jgi:dTDP-4-dehydrorhamnose 3,5-epimerase-like enzyme